MITSVGITCAYSGANMKCFFDLCTTFFGLKLSNTRTWYDYLVFSESDSTYR